MVRLIPMTEATFEAYLSVSVGEYAAEKVRAGNWAESEALERSAQSYTELLPNGVATPDNYLFTILAGETPVGELWFAVRQDGGHRAAFIYDFAINEEHRRQGYAAQALTALEAEVQELGLDRISLHVFGHNQPAISLYQKMGYLATNINMTKRLSAEPS